MLEILFIKLSQASILYPLVLGLLFYKKLDRPFRFFTWYFMLGAGIELICIGLKYYYETSGQTLSNYLFLEHLLVPPEFCAFAFLYYSAFQALKGSRELVVVAVALQLSISFADAFWLSGLSQHNENARTLSAMLLSLFAFLYYYYFFKSDTPSPLFTEPMFWVSAGVLLYFASNAFLFLLSNYLTDHYYSLANSGYNLHALLNILAHLLYGRAFLCFRRISR